MLHFFCLFFLHKVCLSFYVPYVFHLAVAHVFSLEAIFCLELETLHRNVFKTGQVELSAAIIGIRGIGSCCDSVHLISQVGWHLAHVDTIEFPVLVNVTHVLVSYITGGAAEVGTGLAVYVIQGEGVGVRLQDIYIAEGNAEVEAVRPFIVQRETAHVLQVFAVNGQVIVNVVGQRTAPCLSNRVYRAVDLCA